MKFKRFLTSVVSVVVMSSALVGLNPSTAAAASPCPYLKYSKVICVNKTSKKVFLFENGKQVMVMDARFGRVGEETREGFFRVNWKNANHVSSIYGSKMPYSMFFSGGQAIHYSEDFRINGYFGASHGCVNTRDLAATKALYNRTPVGTPVVVYKWVR